MSALLRATQAGSRQSQPNANLRASSSSADLLKPGASPARKTSDASAASNNKKLVNPALSLKRQLAAIPKPPKDWKQQLKGFYKRHQLKYLNPLVFIMVHMFLGSLIFLWLEGSEDEKRLSLSYESYKKEKELLLRRVEEILENSIRILGRSRKSELGDRAARARPVRRKFISEAVEYFEEQIGFSVNNETKWDLSTAMYYAGTLFTTIGYGDVACVTASGRISTVIYSIIGIPLMLITLNDLGKFLYESINGCVTGMEDTITTLGVFRLWKRTPHNVEVRVDDLDVERGETATIDSLHSELGSTRSYMDDDMDDFEDEKKTPQMSVKVAISITFGWIFLCAALFRLWENWTYGESLYFMYISLSTIGLGDIAVVHKGMMVLCFVFVIIGLSLVSMTINVVQVAIEDLYVAFLMKLIMEYQEKLAQGGDAKGASMGMLSMWGSNKTAKLLMPLIGKERKRMAMETVEQEAKKKGIEMPTILKEVDQKTGMPKILQIEEKKLKKDEPLTLPPELEIMVEKHIAEAEEAAPLPVMLSSSYFKHDADTQTETVVCIDENEQTLEATTEEVSSQTDRDEKEETQDAEMQTLDAETTQNASQTTVVEMQDDETATPQIITTENDSQTPIIQTLEQELQTYVVEYADAETSSSVETKNIRIQTPRPQILDRTVQTEDLTEGKSHSPSKMSSARKRIRRALRITTRQRRNTLGEQPAMSDWVDQPSEVEGEGDEEDEDEESLHWDPVDGLHAEKQLPVQKLKAMFDRKPSAP